MTWFCSLVKIVISPIIASIRRFSLVKKNRITNQLASRARKDYFYLDAFWRENLGMYILIRCMPFHESFIFA